MKKNETLLYHILKNGNSPLRYIDTLEEIEGLKEDIELNQEYLDYYSSAIEDCKSELQNIRACIIGNISDLNNEFDLENDLNFFNDKCEERKDAISELERKIKRLERKCVVMAGGWISSSKTDMEQELEYIHSWADLFCTSNYYCYDISTLDNFELDYLEE